MKLLKNLQKMLGKFYVQLFVKFSRKKFWDEICNNFKENVENISVYGNIVKDLRKFKTF